MTANVYRINLLNERVYETNQLSELEFALRTERIREENLLYRDEYLNVYATSPSNESDLQATSFVFNGVHYPDHVSNDIIDVNSSLDVFNCDLNKQESTQQLSLVGLLCILIVVTVIGNTLIILAVLTTRRLRTVTNCFVMSLAVADWLVGIFVMPPAVAYNLMGRWELGWILCDIWISLDILLCTASILSLCAISVDRYLAVTRPLTYSRRRRSKKLALSMILAVWLAAGAITCPPMFGWYDPAHNICGECRYNQNLGYVVFSAMGSFFLPLAVMVYVYARIGWVVARRHLQLTSSVTKDSHKRSSNVTCVRSESDSGSVDRTSARLNHGTITISNSSKCLSHSVNQNDHSTCDCHEYSPCCVTLASGDRKSCHSTRKFRYSMRNHLNVEKRDSFRKCSADEVNFKSSHRNKFTIRSRPNSYRDTNSETNKVSSLRRETKTAKTVSVVVGGFVICWLPFFVYYIVIPFIPEEDSVLMSFLTWLGWFNSAINPFIYAFYSKEFRLAFWRLTIKKCVRGSR